MLVQLLLVVLVEQCMCQEVNVTPESSQAIWSVLREAFNSERLHHSDECDPTIDDNLFHKMMNLNRGSITEQILDRLSKEIKMTCDWKRYMFCDSTRKRCVCAANSVWVPLTTEEKTNMLGYNGKCVLRPNSTCYASKEEHSKDRANILGINPPYTACAGSGYQTHCLNRTCQCLDPTSQECRDLDQIFTSRLRHIINKTRDFKWAGLDEPCTFKSPLIIDSRIHTLRSVDLKLSKWKEDNVSLGNICDTHLGLECQHKASDPLSPKGTCQCADRSTWFNGTCYGELGYLCQYSLWAEADAVGVDTPCMETLSCTRVHNLGVYRSVYACCFVGYFWSRSYVYDRQERLFCPLRGQILTSSFFVSFFSTLLLVFSRINS